MEISIFQPIQVGASHKTLSLFADSHSLELSHVASLQSVPEKISTIGYFMSLEIVRFLIHIDQLLHDRSA